MPPLFHYALSGLVVQSNEHLPGLERVERQSADLYLTVEQDSPCDPWPVPDGAWLRQSPAYQVWRAKTSDAAFIRLRYADDYGEIQFVVDGGGSQMWITCRGTATLGDVSALLTGPVLGCILRVRGLTLLHSSVVSVEGRALAMIGNVKAGKSTTAMALLQHGAAILADDVAALVPQGERFSVRPCEPRLRLAEDSATVFGGYDLLQPIWSPGDNRPQKRYIEPPSQRDGSPPEVPLAAVYVLEPRDPNAAVPSITSASATEAVLKLMANRFVVYHLDRAEHARDFQTLCRLADCTPVRIVQRPDSLEKLPALSDAILSDYRALIRP